LTQRDVLDEGEFGHQPVASPIRGDHPDALRQLEHPGGNGVEPRQRLHQLAVAGSFHGGDSNDLMPAQSKGRTANAPRAARIGDVDAFGDSHGLAGILGCGGR